MQTTKLTQNERVAFATALKNARKFDIVDEALMLIQDLDPSNDIQMNYLPKSIPESVRKQLVFLSKQRAKAEEQIEEVLGQLEEIAEREFDRRSELEEAKKPHCEKCGQALPAKRRK